MSILNSQDGQVALKNLQVDIVRKESLIAQLRGRSELTIAASAGASEPDKDDQDLHQALRVAQEVLFKRWK